MIKNIRLFEMPFISNDVEFLFLGDDEPYDEAEYRVVRKLYVELKSKSYVSYTCRENEDTAND